MQPASSSSDPLSLSAAACDASSASLASSLQSGSLPLPLLPPTLAPDAVGVLRGALTRLRAADAILDIEAPALLSAAPPSPAPGAASPPLSSLVLLQCARSGVRALRNACALGPAAQSAVSAAGGPAAVAELLAYDARSPAGGGGAWDELQASTRRTAWQCLANTVAGGHAANAAQVWQLLWPEGAAPGISLPLACLEAARADSALPAILAALIYSCIRGEGDAAAGRAARLAGDAVVLPRLLSFATEQAGRAGGEEAVDNGAPETWNVLVVGALVRHGLLARAYASAGAGTPLALLLLHAEAAGDGAEQRTAATAAAATATTAEQLCLLGLLEVHMEAELQVARRAEGGVEGGESGATVEGGGKEQSGREEAVLTEEQQRGQRGAVAVLTPADASFLASTLGVLCTSALLALERARSGAAARALAAPEGGDARASVVLRSLLCGVGILCDTLADVLAGAGGGEDEPACGHVASAAGEARALRGLLCSAAPPLALDPGTLARPPLAAVLDLLAATTPAARGPSAGAGPAPTLFDFDERDGSVRAVETEPAGAGADGSAQPEAADAGAGGPVLPSLQPPAGLLPPLPRGTRSSLVRLVALACEGSSAAARVVLSAGPPAARGVYDLLAACALDRANPLAREWALMAVRALCRVSEEAVGVIRSVKRERAESTAPLAALGVRG